MQNLNKVINDFKVVEEDLQELMKTKDFDHKRFFEMIKINVGVFKNKMQYFFEHEPTYAKELEKEDKKSNK